MSPEVKFLKRIATELNWISRRLTASQRALPNCYIVGAQKAGTSSLYHYLIQHPQVAKSLKKEIHYFDGGTNQLSDDFKRGDNWYKAHFALKKYNNTKRIHIDATPLYLFNPLVAQRIHQCTPNAKIIILLRDPVERAISHYYHVKRHGFESLSFEEALNKEQQRLAPCYVNSNFKDPAFRLYSYQARGMYLQQIKSYYQHFNQSQILILNSDDLFSQAKIIIQKVLEFLNIDPRYQIPDLKSQNIGPNKQQVQPETRLYLQKHFHQENKNLFHYLEKTFNWE